MIRRRDGREDRERKRNNRDRTRMAIVLMLLLWWWCLRLGRWERGLSKGHFD